MLIFRLAWSVAICLFFTSCVTDGATEAGGSIYYRTQAEADAALAAFDRDNPSCQLWTNWQKMCSRTGPDGETYCVNDPDRPVKPSVPFCAQQPGTYLAFEERSSTTQKSMLRFCVKPELLMAGLPTEDDGCLKYAPNRPFNGRRYPAFSHPWCTEWKEVNTKKSICREDVEGRISCSSVFPRKRLSKPSYCAVWSNKMKCSVPENTYYYAESSVLVGNQPPGSIIIEGLYGLNSTPIVGLYCGDNRYGQ